jgi:hypothetical protein
MKTQADIKKQIIEIFKCAEAHKGNDVAFVHLTGAVNALKWVTGQDLRSPVKITNIMIGNVDKELDKLKNVQ